MIQHPPKPRFALRVGITGHRPNKLPVAAAVRIDRQLREVFEAVETAARTIHHDNKAVYNNDTPTDGSSKPYSIRLISGFAEGADQMAVAACPSDWTIEAALPFPKEEYLKDFEQSAAGDGRDVREQFLESLARASVITESPTPRTGDRAHGYVMAGGFMLRQIDLLVAVWDGEAPKPGGTGAIAKQAREGGIPVVWLSTVIDREPRLIAAFDDDEAVLSDEAWGAQALIGALSPILAAPSGQGRGRRDSPRVRLEQFYAERWQPVCRMRYYDMLKQWANGAPLRRRLEAKPYEQALVEFDQLIDDAPKADPLNRKLKDVLGSRHVWADALAVHFSHNYRSAYVLAYFLSAVAVFIALLGAFAADIHQKAFVVALELAAIGTIVQIVRHGRKNAWHERWIDYRAIAESLRHGRFLAFVSEFGHIRTVTTVDQPWTVWYIRATMREVGLPHATLDEAYQRTLLQATRQHEVKGQIGYHHDNAHAMEQIDHFLHKAGNFCFLFTFWMLIAYLVTYATYLVLDWRGIAGAHALYVALSVAKYWMIVLAAGLPAAGAALAGIRVQGDFDGSKERSTRMFGELSALDRAYGAAIERQPELNATANMLIETAREMSEDLAAWQDLYGRKRLNLPA